MATRALTKAYVERLEAGERSVIHWDARVVGFGVRVSPLGRKTFVVRYRAWSDVHGRRRDRKVSLGLFPAVGVEQARRQAREYLGAVARGEDPVKARPAAPVLTVGGLVERWGDGDGRARREQRRALRFDVVPAWGDRPVASITRVEVAALHERVASRSESVAAVVLRALRSAINWAVAQDLLPEDHRNPVRGIRLETTRRDRYLRRHEAPALFESLRVHGHRQGVAYVLAVLCTALRRTDALRLRWEDIDLDSGVLSAHVQKTDRRIYLPVVRQLAAVLAAVPKVGPYVFASGRWPERHATVKLPNDEWVVIRARAGLDDLRLHDLRRTVGSWLAQSGASKLTIAAVLGHAGSDTTDTVYAHMNASAVRAPLQAFADDLEAAAGMTMADVLAGAGGNGGRT